MQHLIEWQMQLTVSCSELVLLSNADLQQHVIRPLLLPIGTKCSRLRTLELEKSHVLRVGTMRRVLPHDG